MNRERLKDGLTIELAKLALAMAFFASVPAFAAETSEADASSAVTSERQPASTSPSKTEVLNRLRQIQLRQVQEIGTLEDSVKKALKESTNLTLKEDLNAANRKITRLGETLSETDKRRTELLARREIIDQLILLIDSKWDGKGLQPFLEHSLLDIANGDLTSAQGSGDTWRFMIYLSIAVREVPEPREDLLGVVESYMNFASVLNPRSPAEFMANRNYSNGSESISARAVTRDSLGDYVETRTRELSRLRTAPARPKGTMSTVGGDAKPDAKSELKREMKAEAKADARTTVGSTLGGTSSGATSSPGAGRSTVPTPVSRPELELRVRKPIQERVSDPTESRDSGTMVPTLPPEDEKPEPMYVSPRLKAIN